MLVLPQWNSDANGHVGLCRILAWSGMSALRLALPYHDQRMPPELQRADYIVSSNVARTVQVCRQAVLDARRAIQWLARQGYERIGILGTSLGSCLALLTTAHEPLIRAQALNHISPYFADVVWRGLSTQHVRQGFDGRIELDLLRTLWKPISPRWYLERVRDRRTLLVYARYDLTFPVDLSEDLVREFRELDLPHEVVVLPCGHYSSGKAPFKFLDAWVLTRFLRNGRCVIRESTSAEARDRLRERSEGPVFSRSLTFRLRAPTDTSESRAAPRRAPRARLRTSGVISPSLTALTTVTGLVRNSQTVATASTMLTTAIAVNRLTPRPCHFIDDRELARRPNCRAGSYQKVSAEQDDRIAEPELRQILADDVEVADDQRNQPGGVEVLGGGPRDVAGRHPLDLRGRNSRSNRRAGRTRRSASRRGRSVPASRSCARSRASGRRRRAPAPRR